jgi:hypothetical protein
MLINKFDWFLKQVMWIIPTHDFMQQSSNVVDNDTLAVIIVTELAERDAYGVCVDNFSNSKTDST